MTRGQKRLKRARAQYRLTFKTVVHDDIDVNLGLIYLWEVGLPDGGVYRYVGKASRGKKRPDQNYAWRCEKYFMGLPYGRRTPLFREPQWQLGDAWASGRPITLTLLCNASNENIDELEAHWQDAYGLPRRTPNGRRRPSPYAGKPLPHRSDACSAAAAAEKSV